jgi:superfamily II DNA helicase RecQ
MPRKKLKRSSPTKKNVKVKRQLESLTESLEKSFRDIPEKIAVQAQKDIASQKLKEAKLQSSLQKMQKQQKALKSKQAQLAAKDKLTPAGKKQLKVSTKASALLNKSITDILKQIDLAKEDVKVLSNKQAKYTALKKEILKLEKEWDKAPAKPKKARKISAKPVAKEEIISDTASLEPIITDVVTESIKLNS